jgi:hypothetical protein
MVLIHIYVYFPSDLRKTYILSLDNEDVQDTDTASFPDDIFKNIME